jgi:hypothetical protein
VSFRTREAGAVLSGLAGAGSSPARGRRWCRPGAPPSRGLRVASGRGAVLAVVVLVPAGRLPSGFLGPGREFEEVRDRFNRLFLFCASVGAPRGGGHEGSPRTPESHVRGAGSWLAWTVEVPGQRGREREPGGRASCAPPEFSMRSRVAFCLCF